MSARFSIDEIKSLSVMCKCSSNNTTVCQEWCNHHIEHVKSCCLIQTGSNLSQ